MGCEIRLPRLNKLSPTLESTLFKIIEEAGELARSVLALLPYEALTPEEFAAHAGARAGLAAVTGELLDVAQTCVSMIFVLEDSYGVRMENLIDLHLAKLTRKGYRYDASSRYFITSDGNYKYIYLPRLYLDDVTLLKTTCKIQEEVGEASQFLGKGAGRSGEARQLSEREVITGSALELLDIAQCCFTMMYILEDKYAIDMPALVENHIAKLKARGYCT